MDKIKKRIMKAIEQLQLADNEMDRLSIMGKPVELDGDAIIMLVKLEKLIGKMKSGTEKSETE